MKEFLLIFAVSFVAVGLMLLGLAITRIIKGRDLQSDVGTNDEMKKLGLTCTSKAFAHEELVLRGKTTMDLKDCDNSCNGCNPCS